MEIEKTFKITKDDVWGEWSEDFKLIKRGMIVAQGYGKHDEGYEEWKNTVKVLDYCPIWKEILPYKSVTVICDIKDRYEVEYWLDYVHGGGIEKWRELPNNKIAIRSNYTCW